MRLHLHNISKKGCTCTCVACIPPKAWGNPSLVPRPSLTAFFSQPWNKAVREGLGTRLGESCYTQKVHDTSHYKGSEVTGTHPQCFQHSLSPSKDGHLSLQRFHRACSKRARLGGAGPSGSGGCKGAGSCSGLGPGTSAEGYRYHLKHRHLRYAVVL